MNFCTEYSIQADDCKFRGNFELFFTKNAASVYFRTGYGLFRSISFLLLYLKYICAARIVFIVAGIRLIILIIVQQTILC